MDKKEIDNIISTVIRISEPLPLDLSMAAYSEWDSLAFMQILLALEEASGRKLTPIDALRLQSLEGIYSLFLDNEINE